MLDTPKCLMTQFFQQKSLSHDLKRVNSHSRDTSSPPRSPDLSPLDLVVIFGKQSLHQHWSNYELRKQKPSKRWRKFQDQLSGKFSFNWILDFKDGGNVFCGHLDNKIIKSWNGIVKQIYRCMVKLALYIELNKDRHSGKKMCYLSFKNIIIIWLR